MQRYHVNYPLLIGLVVGTIVVIGGGYGIWKVQVERNAGRLMTRADEARAEGELLDAAKLYSQYLSIRKDDNEAMEKLANTYADIADAPKVEGKDIRIALGLLERTVLEQPNNQTLRRRLIDMLMSPRIRMLKPALDHISQQLNQTPNDFELEIMRSECLFAANDQKSVAHAYKLIGYDASKDEFDKTTGVAPEEPPIYRRLAAVLRGDQNEQDLADRVIDQMVEANPENGTAYLLRGQYLEAIGKNEEALVDVKRAFELSPEDPSIVIASARVAVKDEDYDLARKLLREGIEANPENSGLYQTLAGVEIQDGNYDKAIEQYEAGAAAVPPSKGQMLYFYKARLQIEQNQLEEAKASIATMRKAEFVMPPFIDYLAARLAMNENDWFKASKEFERLQGFMSKIPDMNVELNYLLGFCYEKLGQFERAKSAYSVTLQTNPTNKMAGYGLSRVQNAMGQVNRGTDNLSIYVALQDMIAKPKNEQDWEAFDDLASRYVDRLGLSEAMRMVLQAEVLMRRELYPEARKKLVDAFKLDPEDLGVRRAAVKLFASDPTQGPIKALKLLDKVVKDFGDMPILRLERGDLLIAVNDEGLTEQLFALADGIEEWETNKQVQLWNGLGQKFARLNDRASQLIAMTKVAELSPGDLPTLEKMFMMARESNDHAGMLEAQKKILAVVGDKGNADYQITEAHRLIAKYRNEKQNPPLLDQAEKFVDQGLVDRPEWNKLHLLKAEIRLLRGDAQGALASFDRASSLGRPTALSLYQHVKLLANYGRFADVILQVEKVNPALRIQLLGQDYADALLRQGRAGEAILTAEKRAEAAASNSGVQLWFGQFLSRASGVEDFGDDRKKSLIEQAGVAFRKAVDLAPNSNQAWLALIGYHAATKDMLAAEEAIREAQLVLIEDQTGLMFARCYEIIGRWIDAEALYKQAVKDAKPEAKARSLRLLAAFYLGSGYPKGDKVEQATPLINGILQEVVDGNLPPTSSYAQWARSTAARILASQGEYQKLLDAERLLASNVVGGELPAADRLLMAEILTPRPEPISRKKAVRLLERLRESQKLSLKSELDLGRLYYALGDWRRCREQMINVIARYPKEPKVRLAYLKMLLERGGPNDIALAIPQLKRLSQLAPSEISTREMIARVALKRGKKQEAAGAIRGMLPKNLAGVTAEQLPLVMRVAQLLTEFENYEGAKPLYQLGAQKGGVGGKLNFLLFTGQHLDVAKGFEGLEALRASGVDTPSIIQKATAILRSPANEGDHPDEMALTQGWINRSLREDPQSVSLRLQQAELYDINQQYEKAVEVYRQLLDENDLQGVGRAVVLNNLAYLLALAPSEEGGVDEARGYVNEAVNLLGPQTDILDTRAMIKIAAKQYEGAIDDLSLAVIDRPTATKYFHLAIAHLQAGQNQMAANAWKKAIDLGLTRESVSRLEKEQYDKIQAELESLGLQSAQL